MHRLLAAAVFIGSLVCASTTASAQAFSRVWVDVDFGVEPAAQKNFTAAISPTIFGETANYSAAYTLGNARGFGIGAGGMMNKQFGFGVAYGNANDGGSTATISAHVPHPAFFNAYGDDTQPSADLMPRTETYFHLHAMYVVVDGGKLRVRAFGGPSRIKVSQTQIDDFSYTQSTSGLTNIIRIQSSTHTTTDGTAWGFHVGGDVAYFFTKNLGAGGYVKFIRGTVDLANALPGGSTMSIKAGGTQYGGAFFVRY